jgi:hypothetical protein
LTLDVDGFTVLQYEVPNDARGNRVLYIDELPSTQAVFDGGVASVGASTDCGREQYVDKGRYWCGSIKVEDSWDLCHAAGMRDEPRANLCIWRH